jgi:hypothetical protein
VCREYTPFGATNRESGMRSAHFGKWPPPSTPLAGIATALPKFIVVHLSETRSNLFAIDWRFVRKVGQILLRFFTLPVCGREKGTGEMC